MQLTINPPRSNTTATTSESESEKVELRKKLLEMIRQNESQRRKTEK
jgi:hypothetical protein